MKVRIPQIIRCKKCQSSNVVKSGKVNDNQRYKCKEGNREQSFAYIPKCLSQSCNNLAYNFLCVYSNSTIN